MRINIYQTQFENDFPKVIKQHGVTYPENSISNPNEISNMMNRIFHLTKQTEEYLYLLCFNNKMKIIGIYEISHGTVNMTAYSAREIFMKALLLGAVNICMVHNHPSEDCTPSEEDQVAEKNIFAAGKILSIKLIDFIIIGESFFSFAEEGVL